MGPKLGAAVSWCSLCLADTRVVRFRRLRGSMPHFVLLQSSVSGLNIAAIAPTVGTTGCVGAIMSVEQLVCIFANHISAAPRCRIFMSCSSISLIAAVSSVVSRALVDDWRARHCSVLRFPVHNRAGSASERRIC